MGVLAREVLKKYHDVELNPVTKEEVTKVIKHYNFKESMAKRKATAKRIQERLAKRKSK